MKIGVMPPTGVPVATGEFVSTVARAAEERGFHSLWAPEHVVFFREYASRYPYSEDGRVAAGGGPIDPFLVLTWAAAATTTLRVGTGICLVPQRNPVYTAKDVASLDWLSGGRFDFGIGIGWLKEEFQALGVPWKDRAGRTREYLEVMKRLWTEDPAEYHGDFYDLPACRQSPRPVQDPYPPLIFGGESEGALRRVADQGQGWFGFNLGPDEAAHHLGHLTVLLEQRSRTRGDISVSICPGRRRLEDGDIERYAEAGVDQVILIAGGRDAESTIARFDDLARLAVEPASRM
jgi:probable F420-dependent oxidoreductase